MRVLVHACCGPCSMAVLEKLLADKHDVTVFFHNPNIQPLAEYIKRREGAELVARHFGVPIIFSDMFTEANTLCGDAHLDALPLSVNPVSWLRQMHEKEGDRCYVCWETRIAATALFAKENGFDAISTTLLYSRYQNHEAIKNMGENLALDKGLTFLYEDFRVLWQHGITLSKELGIYRQQYCGCIYSEYARYAKDLKKAQGKTFGVA